MKSNGMRFKAVIAACALLLSMALTSCEPLMDNSELNTTVAGSDVVIPAVSGFIKNTSINKKLESEFLPAAEQMKGITDASDNRLHVEYKMTEINGGLFRPIHRITMYLSDDSNAIELKSVEISGFDTVKSDGSENLAWLDSTEVAESALVMKRFDIGFDSAALDQASTERNAVEVFLKLYEGFAGKEVDLSDIKIGSDPVTQKGMLLGMIDYYGNADYQYEDSIYPYRMSVIAAKVMTAIERDVYGRQSETVTGKQFAAMLHTFYTAMRVHDDEDSEHLWSDLGKVDTDEILRTMGMTDSPFTRRDAAELVGRITKEGPKYSMKFSDHNLERVDDAFDSIWARRAITHGFMNYYGDSTLFAPQEELTTVNAIASAQCYMNTRYNDWSYTMEHTWNGCYTNEDVIVSAAKVAEYFDDRTDADKSFEVKTVINDRDYDWFFSQKDTGEYSAINCMPSIAAMASHWYDQNSTATVKKMRETSDYTEGWTAYELRSGLSAYNVPFTVKDATLDNITEALDNGCIVLAQYSDRPYGVSGHCYVIYGYKKFKDSTTFIVNDSDSLSSRAELFGKKAGNGDEIEARFSIWTISRFVDDVTVIGSDSNNN